MNVAAFIVEVTSELVGGLSTHPSKEHYPSLRPMAVPTASNRASRTAAHQGRRSMMPLRERATFTTVSMMMMLSASAVFEAGIQRKSKTRSPSRRRPRPKFETIVAYLSARQFQHAFRLSLPSFAKVLLILRDDLAKNEEMAKCSSGGVIEPAVRLALTFRILSGASYHDMMLLFRLAKSTVFDVFFETVKSLNCCVKHAHVSQT
jgi:hypothetical protein